MKQLIEVDFPIFDVSEQSAREKNIRHGHISTLHIWWARRPLAACRAAIYASLVPAPKSEVELKEKMKFITELSKWENSLNEKLLSKAREDILNANGGKPPKVLDCFAGGGAIPLEALRLGCESYALELNPVAVLILKATLEYPQKYGKKLVKDVEKWGKWVLEEAKKEIGKFYPEETEKGYFSDDANEGEKWIPVGYIWARTIKCQNPTCGAEIPLMRQFWLRKKTDSDNKVIWNDSIYLKPKIYKENKKVDFEIIEGKKIEGFDPTKGTRPTVKARASFTCPICDTNHDTKTIRKIGKEGEIGQKMICVVLHNPDTTGKRYRSPNDEDIKIYIDAKSELNEKAKTWRGEYPAIPAEPMVNEPGIAHPIQYLPDINGAVSFGQIYNYRQLLSIITLIEKVNESRKKIIDYGYDKGYGDTISTFLALGIDEVARFNTTLNVWKNDAEAVVHIFGRQAISMAWDYFENNSLSDHGGTFTYRLNQMMRVIGSLIFDTDGKQFIGYGSATNLNYDENYFDAVITDPPYYDNIPYADLSDFFYVWLKRTIGNLYPDLFATPLTPKSEEIIQIPIRHNKNKEKAKKFYENMMSKAFQEMNKVLKPEGIATIVFAHKSTEAWETLINALINAGLVPTSSWPIHTEMKARLMARESAALASSIFLTCRKREGDQEAYFKDIRKELEERIRERLNHFWSEGIRGADFFISAIGPAVEIYGKYSKVKRLSGEEMDASELLNHVRQYVSEYALSKILKGVTLEKIDPITRFYILWRWTYNGQTIEYDDARKLSQAVGVELDKIWGKGNVVKKSEGKIEVLSPKDREIDEIKDRHPVNLIDALHKSCLLWQAERAKELENYLSSTGYLSNPLFWETAQALSELLPSGDKEKLMIHGLLVTSSPH